jgi:hypothetical protein
VTQALYAVEQTKIPANPSTLSPTSMEVYLKKVDLEGDGRVQLPARFPNSLKRLKEKFETDVVDLQSCASPFRIGS